MLECTPTSKPTTDRPGKSVAFTSRASREAGSRLRSVEHECTPSIVPPHSQRVLRRRRPRMRAHFTSRGRRRRHPPGPLALRKFAPMTSTPSREPQSLVRSEHRFTERHTTIEPMAHHAADASNSSSSHSLQSLPNPVQTFKLRDAPLDPSVLDRKASRLSLQHWLFEIQPTLREGPIHSLPKVDRDPQMDRIMPTIKQAFARRPVEWVEPERSWQIQEVVGHFWSLEAFDKLPDSLRHLLARTYEAERREIEFVHTHGWPSGFKIKAEGAQSLGMPEHIVQAWRSGSRLPLSAPPEPFSRPPYSSVYSSLQTLEKVCEETLRLVQAGKAIPWLQRPFIVSPTNCIFKPSAFEPDGVKKRICWDLTKSGLNLIINIDPSSLPTIFTLIESMGPGYFMAKSDLKDMFLNFPIAKEHWTLLGFSHPVTGQYLVLPFYPFGLKNAPPDCQGFAEAVKNKIHEECVRRIHHQPSLPGLDEVPAGEPGLRAAVDEKAVASHVYIDDFQHLTQLLSQGEEVFAIGAKIYEILGLVEKIIKREGPARVMTLLGFVFDSTTHTLSVPPPKCAEMIALIEVVLAMGDVEGSVSFSIMQSLVGKLVWASTGIELGRSCLADIRRPLDAVASSLTTPRRRAHFLIPIASFPKLISALRWWLAALRANNGSSVVHVGPHGLYERWRWDGEFGDEVPDGVLQIFTDACPEGGGWSWGSERQAFKWSGKERRHHINILEAYTVLKMLRRDADSISRTRVLLWCDNQVSVAALRKGNSISRVLCEILRSIRLICLQYQIDLWPVHIDGVRNVVADGLSRGLLASRSSTWSLNRAIMARWRAQFGPFDVDVFTDPSGSGAQAFAFCSVLDPPWDKSFRGQKVWAFPPLDLVDAFLEHYQHWHAASVIAVLPSATIAARIPQPAAQLLHSYGSHFGICERASGQSRIACPAIGWDLGVYILH